MMAWSAGFVVVGAGFVGGTVWDALDLWVWSEEREWVVRFVGRRGKAEI